MTDPMSKAAESLERSNEMYARDIATYPERARAARHHDIVCASLKAMIGLGHLPSESEMDDLASRALYLADKLYPPPKETP